MFLSPSSSLHFILLPSIFCSSFITLVLLPHFALFYLLFISFHITSHVAFSCSLLAFIFPCVSCHFLFSFFFLSLSFSSFFFYNALFCSFTFFFFYFSSHSLSLTQCPLSLPIMFLVSFHFYTSSFSCDLLLSICFLLYSLSFLLPFYTSAWFPLFFIFLLFLFLFFFTLVPLISAHLLLFSFCSISHFLLFIVLLMHCWSALLLTVIGWCFVQSRILRNIVCLSFWLL
jgi:hypothetical protein